MVIILKREHGDYSKPFGSQSPTDNHDWTTVTCFTNDFVPGSAWILRKPLRDLPVQNSILDVYRHQLIIRHFFVRMNGNQIPLFTNRISKSIDCSFQE